MQLFGIQTRLVKPKDDLVGIILEAITRQRLAIDDGDVLVFASKVVSMAQGRLARLDRVDPSEEAKRLAEKYELDSRFAEVVLSEADEVYGGVPGALLTLKDGVLIANAGVDRKNAPVGFVVLWPENPHKTAEKIKAEILERAGRRVGVLIVDSRVTPLRMAKKDLYGNEVRITRHALADDLAGAAHLVMGETEARMPAVLAKQVPISLAEEADPELLLIAASECLFMSSFV